MPSTSWQSSSGIDPRPTRMTKSPSPLQACRAPWALENHESQRAVGKADEATKAGRTKATRVEAKGGADQKIGTPQPKPQAPGMPKPLRPLALQPDSESHEVRHGTKVRDPTAYILAAVRKGTGNRRDGPSGLCEGFGRRATGLQAEGYRCCTAKSHKRIAISGFFAWNSWPGVLQLFSRQRHAEERLGPSGRDRAQSAFITSRAQRDRGT